MNTNSTILAQEITAALPAGFRAKAWAGRHVERIYVYEGKKEPVHHEFEKGSSTRNGKTFGRYADDGTFHLGGEDDLGATQIVEAGYRIMRGA